MSQLVELGVELRADKIADTAETLTRRIDERFVQSGLGRIAHTIHGIANETSANIDALQKPMWSLRIGSFGIGFLSFVILTYLMMGGIDALISHDPRPSRFYLRGGAVFGKHCLLTAYVVFLKTIEQRHKERRILQYLNHLRSLAHVIDMHQLTKDPERLLILGPDTASSPKRELPRFLLRRYLN